tara:strand:- start:142 stop:414 length:273 start_codon:yes stop_codon:yes gene_type:complete
MSHKHIKLFTADWCKKCKEEKFLKFIETVKKENPEWEMFSINIDDEDSGDEDNLPTAVPTIQLVVERKIVETLSGQSEILEQLEMSLTAY